MSEIPITIAAGFYPGCNGSIGLLVARLSSEDHTTAQNVTHLIGTLVSPSKPSKKVLGDMDYRSIAIARGIITQVRSSSSSLRHCPPRCRIP